jgi:hypothetical protein
VRFLTRDWHGGARSDAESEAVAAAYNAHRASVLPLLPVRFRVFAETVDIHDAMVREIRLDLVADTLCIDLRAGDLRQGYFDLSIRYGVVDVSTINRRALALIAQDPDAEALYHEVDVAANGRYEHRWLWWPYRELDVRFVEFDFATELRSDRIFQLSAAPFVEIVEPAG